jgi:uncharacterized protein (DUF608 family)
MDALFDTACPEREWSRIRTRGFERPLPGAVFRSARRPCCGMPLGGVGTGCIDLDVGGVWGHGSLFNGYTFNPDTMRIPRVAPSLWPMLGLAVDGAVWVLASQEFVDGGLIPCCTEPFILKATDRPREPHRVPCQDLKGVNACRDIAYFGHFPVADLEFESDAPVSVGLRAWAPFIPGDALASNTPGAVFEVHARNGADAARRGSIVLNFPGPSAAEARSAHFLRTAVREGAGDALLDGILVSALGSDTGYFIGALGAPSRTGAGLNRHPRHWAGVATALPAAEAVDREGGGVVTLNADASVAVDFDLAPGEERVVRFVLAWYSPFILGAPKAAAQLVRLRDAPGAELNSYTSMYAVRFRTALEVARRIAAEHESLLARVLSWQAALCAEERLPVWMRDQLVSTLALIAEDSYWVQPRPPLGDWAFPGGLFGLNESSRGCPHMECIPCSFYGNMPVVYFFPELALSTLQAFREYQRDDGNIPFELGAVWSLPDFATPTYDWQQALNGSCYIALADRYWQRTGDDAFLGDFYESLKACNSYVMGLNTGYGGPVSMPAKGPKTEWFEFGEWDGICAHMGGIRLAQLQIMRRMAEHRGDAAYAERCGAWLQEGSSAIETELWNGSYYRNFVVKESGRISDEVMAYQNVGQWMSAYHGFDGVFDHARVRTALETVQRINIALAPAAGAVNFARPDARPVDAAAKLAFYGSTALFVAEAMMLGMVFMIEGRREYGLEFLQRLQRNNALVQGHPWDLPCIMRGDTGERNTGTDYYQNMMFWAVPATVLGTDLRGLCAPGGWIDAVLKAGAAPARVPDNRTAAPASSVPLVDTGAAS